MATELQFNLSQITATRKITLQFHPKSELLTVQQDTQSVLMSQFIHHICYLDMFRTSPVHHQERFIQAVFADLVCGNTRTTRHVQLDAQYYHIPHLRIQLVKDAPDDGPVRSETCRTNISAE